MPSPAMGHLAVLMLVLLCSPVLSTASSVSSVRSSLIGRRDAIRPQPQQRSCGHVPMNRIERSAVRSAVAAHLWNQQGRRSLATRAAVDAPSLATAVANANGVKSAEALDAQRSISSGRDVDVPVYFHVAMFSGEQRPADLCRTPPIAIASMRMPCSPPGSKHNTHLALI